eukprot:TRINITY_DN31425_c0_g1_i1.p1 TRINITY_DN31425_c0_g1~~TRINITY_DN31425_c0_g1_i1.p1  ORF type:complete len:532 (+),score=112.64 TRINITY_DN31425_c0_g1_i1:60-1655(+)
MYQWRQQRRLPAAQEAGRRRRGLCYQAHGAPRRQLTSLLWVSVIVALLTAALRTSASAWVGQSRLGSLVGLRGRLATQRLPRSLFAQPEGEDLQDTTTEAKARLSLEELTVGSEVTGRVTKSSIAYGITVSIGAERLAKLTVPKPVLRREWHAKLKRGEDVQVTIDSIDLQKRRVNVKLKDEAAVTGAWLQARQALSELSVGAQVDGYVVEKKKKGVVLIDFGAAASGLLRCEPQDGDRLEWMEELKGLEVAAVDVEKGTVELKMKNLKEVVKGRGGPAGDSDNVSEQSGKPVSVNVRFKVNGAKGSARDVREKVLRGLSVNGLKVENLDLANGVVHVAGEAPSASKAAPDAAPKEPKKPPRTLQPISGVPGLETGSIVEGTVTVSNLYGVFVNIGQETDAKLNISKPIGAKLKFQEKLTVLRVDGMMSESGRIRVSFADPAVVKSIEEREDTRLPWEELKEGAVVEGYVADKGPKGTFVDIGCTKLGRLSVAISVGKTYALGDFVTGLKVSEVSKKMVRLELPEGAAEQA